MDFFSRIYDVAFGEKGNKDLREHKEELATLARKEEEQKADSLVHLAEASLKEIEESQEKRLEKMRMEGGVYIFGDYRFELEDAQANLRCS